MARLVWHPVVPWGSLPAKAKAILEIAVHNCERLTTLINDLLDMEKIQSGKMEFHSTPQSVAPIVEQALNDASTYAAQHKVRLQFTSDADTATAVVDANRLAQVVANLVSNAIKFSHSNSVVDVRLSRENQQLLLSVTDYGEGIPESFHPLMFEKFSQAEAPITRRKGGAGLGLSISKSMMERMSGTIGFASVVGEGSCFFIQLPEVDPSQPPTE